jgi:hypothetical protein
MTRGSHMLFRIALAVPLALGAYRFAVYGVRSDSWDTSGLVIRLTAYALPALCLSLGIVLLLGGSRRRWPWLLVAGAAGWVLFVTWYVGPAWRSASGPSADLIVGAYALLLSLSMLSGASVRSPDRLK